MPQFTPSQDLGLSITQFASNRKSTMACCVQTITPSILPPPTSAVQSEGRSSYSTAWPGSELLPIALMTVGSAAFGEKQCLSRCLDAVDSRFYSTLQHQLRCRGPGSGLWRRVGLRCRCHREHSGPHPERMQSRHACVTTHQGLTRGLHISLSANYTTI
jgi:hypothetical protein